MWDSNYPKRSDNYQDLFPSGFAKMVDREFANFISLFLKNRRNH